MVRRLSTASGIAVIPEHNDWIGGSKNFPPVPKTVEEKKAKQRFFMNIDLNRERWAQDHSHLVDTIVADADFLSPLAHNYAERWLYPELDVYPWMVSEYSSALLSGALTSADLYIYLDVPTVTRRERRSVDVHRKRNDVFFSGPLPENMRRFYRSLLHETSERASLPALWHDDALTVDATAQLLLNTLAKLPQATRLDVARLAQMLGATVDDAPLSEEAERRGT